MLAELWDFDTRISGDGKGNPAPQDFLQALTGTPQHFRGYNQTSDHNPQADFKVTLDDTSWSIYYANVGSVPAEIPPLPPGPFSDTAKADAAGLNYRHHLIRDFTFLDAAKNSSIQDLLPEPAWQVTKDFIVQQIAFPMKPDGSEAYVLNYTLGPGPHDNARTYHVLDDSQALADSTPLTFQDIQVGFTALLYELRDAATKQPANVVPNWFGVAVANDTTDFRNVIIYFHPSPGQANYDVNNDNTVNDYQHKSGTKGVHTNWKELFSYPERLGKQLAGAAVQAGDPSSGVQNQVVIVPFLQGYDDVGIFPQYWSFIVKAILDDLYKNRPNFFAPEN